MIISREGHTFETSQTLYCMWISQENIKMENNTKHKPIIYRPMAAEIGKINQIEEISKQERLNSYVQWQATQFQTEKNNDSTRDVVKQSNLKNMRTEIKLDLTFTGMDGRII